jgi:hypothetical protein
VRTCPVGMHRSEDKSDQDRQRRAKGLAPGKYG